MVPRFCENKAYEFETNKKVSSTFIEIYLHMIVCWLNNCSPLLCKDTVKVVSVIFIILEHEFHVVSFFFHLLVNISASANILQIAHQIVSQPKCGLKCCQENKVSFWQLIFLLQIFKGKLNLVKTLKNSRKKLVKHVEKLKDRVIIVLKRWWFALHMILLCFFFQLVE